MKINIFLLFLSAVLLPSCIEDPVEQPNTNKGNFESLWSIIDTKYCYLDTKKIDWDSIHTVYKNRVSESLNELAFFDIMGSMLDELKDGHVNLYSSFDLSRYWKWYTDYPSNFSSSLINNNRYLGDNYRIAGGLLYKTIADGKIGYIYYGSFETGFSDNNIAYIMKSFSGCEGLIIDVRDNGGGSLDYSEQLASYFFTKETVTGYMRHKTGNGHSDFSDPVEIRTPAHATIRWQRPVIVLTNRLSYSATNDFVNRMKIAPNALIVGDKTGGGGGLPFSSELPNGWMVRFSASPMYNTAMEDTEWGIEPDVKDSIKVADEAKGIDTIIEHAVALIKNKK